MGAIKMVNLTTSDMIKLSYIQCFAVAILLLYLIWMYGKKYFHKKELFFLAVTLSIGLVGYAFVMLVTYVFSFGPIEGPRLASFDRYIDTYILICMSIVIMLFIFVDNKKVKSIRNIFIIFLVLFLIQSPGKIVNCIPSLSSEAPSSFEKHANNISKKTKENSKIFLIAQNSNGGYQFYIKYYMNPRVTNLKKYNLPVTKIKDYKKYFDEKIKDYMLQYDYLYLISVDEKFISKYSFLFQMMI